MLLNLIFAPMTEALPRLNELSDLFNSSTAAAAPPAARRRTTTMIVIIKPVRLFLWGQGSVPGPIGKGGPYGDCCIGGNPG